MSRAAKKLYLDALELPVWVLRSGDHDPHSDTTREALDTQDDAATPMTPDGWSWDGLADAVRSCTRCPLHKSRTQTVFGVGRKDADLLVIGEAPGQEEDRQGEPFVGPAGQLLNAMLRGIGLERQDVFIANILKCRPPQNRDPRPEETEACTPYLLAQLALLKPRAILALGRIAAQFLLQSEQTLGRLRGQVRHFGAGQIPLVATYHPAYLLRSPGAKAKAWQDLLLIDDLIKGRK